MSRFPSADFSRFASLPPADRSATVLRAAAELFVLGQEHRRDDLAVFEELFLSVYADAAEADRRAVAEILAPRPDLPPAVAAAIGMDAAPIAALVLETSPALTDLDLVRIACHRGPEHRRLIAGRRRLDRSVVAALILDGDPEVAERLLDNVQVALDAEELEGIRLRAGRHPGVANRLARRGRAPAATPIEAFLALDADARAEALRAAAGEAALKQIETRGRHEPSPASAELAAAMIAAAAAGDRAGLASRIAGALGLDAATARRIVDDAGGEAFAVVLAAIGLDEAAATGLLVLQSGAHDWSYWTVRSLAQLGASLGWRTARAVVERWGGAGGLTRPVETLRQLDPSVRRDAPAPAPVARRPVLRSIESRRA